MHELVTHEPADIDRPTRAHEWLDGALVARCGHVLGHEALWHADWGKSTERAPRAMCARCSRWRSGHETAIVWEIDPEPFDYVREWEVWTPRRTGRPRWHFKTFDLLGWADLGPGADTFAGRYVRRVFYVKAHDRRPDRPPQCYTPFGAPCEAVDPRTLAPNEPGRMTPRAWGPQP